ncbi:MAG: tetratricopeptide repeat protein [Candidatus Hydrogenedentota bacterium]|nr:MAG: tetratricopeptide repeat protein [Candidatus Hydrogenedentota bacterium]
MAKNHITYIEEDKNPIVMETSSFRWLWFSLILLFVFLLAGAAAYFYLSKKETPKASKLHSADKPAAEYAYPVSVPADAQLAEGIRMYKAGFLKKADEIFTDIVESTKPNPVKSFAYMYRGIMADSQGKFTRAIDFLRRSVKLDEKNYYALYNLALALRHRGDFEEALKVLEQAKEINPNAAEAGILQGAIEYDLKRYSKAGEILEDVGEKSDSPLALYNLGLVYKKQGKIAEAKAAFLSAYEKQKEGEIATKAAAQLAILFATDDRADLENAIYYMKKAVALAPSNLKYRYNLALLYAKAGKPQEALAVLEQKPTAKTEDPKVLLYVAKLYDELGQKQKSYHLLQMALIDFPSNPDIRMLAADIAISRGKYEEAERHLKKLLELTASTAKKSQAYFALGKVYTALRKFEQAEDAYRKAYDLDPTNEDALVALGESKVLAGKESEAIQLYKEALNINPDNIHVLLALADLQYKLSFYSASEELYKRALESPLLKPDKKGEVYLKLGMIYLKREAYSTAIEYFEQAAKKAITDSTRFNAYLYLASTQLKDNMPADLVLPNIEKAIALKPRSAKARLLLAKALIQKGGILAEQRAEEELTALIQLSPDKETLSKALTMRGILFYRKGLYMKALDDFNRALEADPSNTEAFENKRVTASRLESAM